MSKLGRNAPCPCGSGRKYKRCCELLRNAASGSVRSPTTNGGEPQFTVEVSQEVEEKIDRLLGRLQRGERAGIHAELQAFAREHPLQHLPQFGLGVYQLLVNNAPAAAAPFFQRAVEI